MLDRGNCGQNSIDLGVFMFPTRARQNSMSSSASALTPSLSSMTALMASPHLESGTPITAQSLTAGCDQSTCSISPGNMLNPPLMIRSRLRSTIYR